MMNVWGNSMFDKIWKEQISQTKGKATIWQPKEKMKPDKPEKDDEDCCEKAKDFYRDMYVKSWHTSVEEMEEEYPGMSIKEIYAKDYNGIANDTDCKEFREIMNRYASRKKPWDMAVATLDFWKECEGNG
jgi:hypothetical protein